MNSGDIVCVLMAYLLGGICVGYYLVRFKAGVDIRACGSGGVGARNVGRILGRPGFALTLLGDSLKGALALLLARMFHVSAWAAGLVVVAVIAGHVWPLALQFRGGRGIATAVGAYLAYDPYIALLLLGITFALMVLRRGFILSGLAAFLLLPLAAGALDFPVHEVLPLAGASAIILYAHRERIRTTLAAALPAKEA
jgi:glycerol-3-phosphate acyltransferase PlsY